MHRVAVFLLCIVGVVVFGITSGMAGDEETMCIPMGDLTLEPPDTVEAKRTPVEFPHTVHFEYACKTCHHQWTAKEPIQSCGTSGCHDLDTPPKPGNDDEAIFYFKKAFHENCLGCHREIKALNKKVSMSMGGSDNRIRPTGPTGCTQCHPK